MEGFLEGEINSLTSEKEKTIIILEDGKNSFSNGIKGIDGDEMKQSLVISDGYFNEALKKIDQDRLETEAKLIKKQEKSKIGKFFDRLFEII